MKARWFFTFLVALVIVAPTVSCSDSSSVSLQKLRVRGAVAHVITVDLNDPEIDIKIGLPIRGIPTSEPFLSMVKRHLPVAAVTGTYFDTRTLYPVGSIVMEGKPAYESAIGTSVCFIRPDGISCNSGYVVSFCPTKKGERFNWTGVRLGLRTGPLLLVGGSYALNPSREGFRHPGLFGNHARMAMGVTSYNKLLLVSVSTPVTFGHLAGLMKALGAVDAASLDGGTSSAMYYRGRVIRRPGRSLTNIIEVHSRPRPAVSIGESIAIANDIVHAFGPDLHTDNRAAWNMPWREDPGFDLHLPSIGAAFTFAADDIYEVAPPPALALTKGRGPLIPVNRT